MWWTVSVAVAGAPCVASASGDGWKASIEADMANGALVSATQRITIDVPALKLGKLGYEYNTDVHQPFRPMARVQITETLGPAVPQQVTVGLFTPEVFAPTDVMLAALDGGTAPPLKVALRLVSQGKSAGWFPVGAGVAVGGARSPSDLAGSNLDGYAAGFGLAGGPPELRDAGGLLAATLLQTGLRVETVVGKKLDNGRMPLPAADDPAATDVAGAFEVTPAQVAPALQAMGGLQAKIGQDYSTGKCGTPPGR